MMLGMTVPQLAYRLLLTSDELDALRALSPKYRVHRKRKSSGKYRMIAVPTPELAKVQRRLLDKLIAKLPISPYVYGGVKGRSHVRHAWVHRAAEAAFVVDLKDAFRHGSRERTRDVLWRCSFQKDVVEAILDLTVHEKYGLPQGAPTSNALFNLLCRELDAELSQFAERFDMRYTRYVDELVLSTRVDIAPETREKAKQMIGEMGFTINPEKVRYYHARHGAIHITGMSVHDGVAKLSKKRVESIRAFLHRARFDPAIGLAELKGVMGQVKVHRSFHSWFAWAERLFYPIPKRLRKGYELALQAVKSREKSRLTQLLLPSTT
jgi:hypothetical protein